MCCVQVQIECEVVVVGEILLFDQVCKKIVVELGVLIYDVEMMEGCFGGIDFLLDVIQLNEDEGCSWVDIILDEGLQVEEFVVEDYDIEILWYWFFNVMMMLNDCEWFIVSECKLCDDLCILESFGKELGLFKECVCQLEVVVFGKMCKVLEKYGGEL